MLKIRGETIVLPVWRHDVMLSRRVSILNLQTFVITRLLYSYFVVVETQVRLRFWEAVQCCRLHSFVVR